MSRICMMYLSELIHIWNSNYAVCADLGTFSLDEKHRRMLHSWPLGGKPFGRLAGYRIFDSDFGEMTSLMHYLITAYVVLYLVHRVYAKLAHDSNTSASKSILVH